MNLSNIELQISNRLQPLRDTLTEFSIPVAMLPQTPMGISEDEENGIINVWISNITGSDIIKEYQLLNISLSCRISINKRYSDTDAKNSVEEIFNILYELLSGYKLNFSVKPFYLNSYQIGILEGRWEASVQFLTTIEQFINMSVDDNTPSIEEIRTRLEGLEIATVK